MSVEKRISGIDRLGIDHNIDRAGFGGFVYGDFACCRIKAAELGGITEVAVFKTGLAMVAVDYKRFRCCESD